MFYWSWIGEPVLIVRTDLEWVVSPSLIYGFWLHFWYLHTCLVKQNYTEHCHTFVLFLLAIVLSVLLWYTDSDYLLGIFKLFLISFFYLIVNNTYYYNIIFFNLYLIYLNNKDTTDTQKYLTLTFNLKLTTEEDWKQNCTTNGCDHELAGVNGYASFTLFVDLIPFSITNTTITVHDNE